jgi:protein-arginine kinase activator protein McsA
MGLLTDEDVHLLKSLIEGKIKELEDTIEVETEFERDAIFRDKIIEGSQRMISKYKTLYKKLET